MGKIVKYCSSCDEGFAEKFGFCPNCGTALQAFEMNRVEAVAAPEPPAAVVQEPVAAEPVVTEVFAAPAVADVWTQPEMIAAPETEIPVVVQEVAELPEVPVEEAPVAAMAAPEVVTLPAAPPVFVQTKAVDADKIPISLEAEHQAYQADGGFYVTVIEEKNVKQRNGLLLGTLGL